MRQRHPVAVALTNQFGLNAGTKGTTWVRVQMPPALLAQGFMQT